jgi:hypothetical protein
MFASGPHVAAIEQARARDHQPGCFQIGIPGDGN